MIGKVSLLLLTAAIGVSLGASDHPPGPEDDREISALRIEGRSQAPGAEPGSIEITYQVVNTSDKLITAWDFGCIQANQAGHGALTFVSFDSHTFIAEARRNRETRRPYDRLVFPGERFEQKIQVRAGELDGPFAAKTCGPLLAIFEDTEFEGSAKMAASRFQFRADKATALGQTRRMLAEALAGGPPLMDALEAIRLRRAKPPSTTEGTDPGANQLAEFKARILNGESFDAQKALSELDFLYQDVMQHLPQSWQEKVREAVQP